MSKSIKNCFYKKLTFESLLRSHDRAKKNKTNRYELLRFSVDIETNIVGIMNSLKDGSYRPGKYKVFTIYEPKERIIKCLPYRDRIVQQWYIYEFIKPYIIPRIINTCCACIDNRGTHYAVLMVDKYINIMKRKYGKYYVLKLDIKKYFYNIDKNILYKIMNSFVSDKKILWLTKIFIYDDEIDKGIPIGNYTSQYFANIYLSILDRYVKEVLKVKYYVRYMDDMVILLSTKEECRIVMEKIKMFLNKELKLELNNKSRYYPSKMGVNFCGYRIYDGYRLIRNGSKRKIKKRIKKWKKDNNMGCLDRKKMMISFNSWSSHIRHANSYHIYQKIYREIENIMF